MPGNDYEHIDPHTANMLEGWTDYASADVLPTEERRVAMPPDLLGPLSPQNAAWLREQQEIAEAGQRSRALAGFGPGRIAVSELQPDLGVYAATRAVHGPLSDTKQ